MLMGHLFMVRQAEGTRLRIVMPTTAARITTGQTENLIKANLVIQLAQVATLIRICPELQPPSRPREHIAQSTWVARVQAGRRLGPALHLTTPS